jgi:hypothetical protein
MKPASGPLVVLAGVLLVAAVGLQLVRDRVYAPYTPVERLLWVRAGPLVTRLALGFDPLIADIYWMRAVVYYGGQRLGPEAARRYDLLAPLLDVVTTLDPRFTVAYRFGAIFLTEAYPSGPGRPDLSIALLRRGIANDGGRWEYMHDIGFVYYWWLQDYQQAATWFSRAATAPNAPAWLEPLAATTLAVGGDRQSSRLLWRHLLEATDSDWIRGNAERRLAQLDALDQLERLNAVAARFVEREGRFPATWAELVRAEPLRGIPTDPTGTPFELDPASGRVVLSPKSPLWPPPQEPRKPGPQPPRALRSPES